MKAAPNETARTSAVDWLTSHGFVNVGDHWLGAACVEVRESGGEWVATKGYSKMEARGVSPHDAIMAYIGVLRDLPLIGGQSQWQIVSRSIDSILDIITPGGPKTWP